MTQDTTKTETISSYMEEELNVVLTRREVYWIRDYAKKRLSSAMQRMNAIAASPAKHSAGREEYEFCNNLISRLYGVEPDEDELRAFREAERARRCIEMQQKAERMRRAADELTRQAREMLEEAV